MFRVGHNLAAPCVSGGTDGTYLVRGLVEPTAESRFDPAQPSASLCRLSLALQRGLRQVERSGFMVMGVELVGLLRWSPALRQFDVDCGCAG